MDILRPRTRAELALLWLGVWVLLACLMTAQEIIANLAGFSWPGLLRVFESRLLQALLTGFAATIAWFGARRLRTASIGWWAKAPLHVLLFALFSTTAVVVASTGRYVVDPILRERHSWAQAVEASFLRSVSFTGLVYSIIVVGELLAAAVREGRARAVENARLHSRLSEARLEALRLQLQPHFLFNTLHAASSLVETQPRSARRMISDLGELLRASLDRGAEQEVTLKQELVLLDRYLDIQRVRFGDRLTFVVDAAPGTEDLLVPSMLLQPLVENAIRHGLSDRPGPGRVEVTSAVVASRLRIVVRDDGQGLAEGALREGVGLGNTRARIAGLYGNDATFEIEPRADGGTEVILQIPVHKDSTPIGTPRSNAAS